MTARGREPLQPETVGEWVAGVKALGLPLKRVGGEWKGPCPVCGGTDRFHVREGSRAAVLASCRGCAAPFEALARAVFGARERSDGPAPADGWSDGRYTAPSHWLEDRLESPPEPRGSPVTAPEPSPGPEDCPPAPDARESLPARLWRQSVPIEAAPEHPARRWAARRNLWRSLEPWPPAIRWIPRRAGGGSLVACFAPVADWTEGHPPGAPSGVQLVHVAPDGSPRKDRDGLGKRSHGTMRGAVAVIGAPLWRAGCVHVAEGLADALAIAAREDAPALATGGTSTLSRLAPSLAALAVPVVVHADGDPAGIVAGRKLHAALAGLGAVSAIVQYPPGCDPAQPKGNA